MGYKLIEKKSVLKTHPFNVEEISLSFDGKPLAHPYHRILAPNWVNILPITSKGEAILIRQPRAGTLRDVLETPGGVIEPNEPDPTLAAARELEEETGYSTQRILPLASLNPNPAIQTNICHFFLGLSCHLVEDRKHFPDAEEHIEIVPVPVAELDHLVRTGQIDHALSALCIMMSMKYLEKYLT